MGQLLSMVKGDPERDITLDFENVEPNPATQPLYEQCEEVLSRSGPMLEALQGYGDGCTKEIRAALSQSSPENEMAVWNAMVPRAQSLKEIHQFSLELGELFPSLLEAICSEDPLQSLQDQQALAKQLAGIFDFVLSFDELKMRCPQLNNDFAYYRRNSNRAPNGVELPVKDEEAASLSLYFADPTPMMGTLTRSVKNCPDQTPDVLAATANICQSMVTKKTYTKPETQFLLLRCMTACIVLFDHVDEKGAFHRRSPISVRRCAGAIRLCEEKSTAEVLFNTIRFSTKHFDDQSTPSAVTDAFTP